MLRGSATCDAVNFATASRMQIVRGGRWNLCLRFVTKKRERWSFSSKIEAPATQGKSQLGAGASWLRAAGGDSTGAGRFTAAQRGRVAENQIHKEPQGTRA